MKSRRAWVASVFVTGWMVLLLAGPASATTPVLTPANRVSMWPDGKAITDTYFVGKNESEVFYFLEPMPDHSTGQQSVEKRKAFLSTILTDDRGTGGGVGTTFERIIAFFKWPVAILTGFFLLIFLWVTVEGWVKGIGKPKTKVHNPHMASAVALMLGIFLLFAVSASAVASHRYAFQSVLFDNATGKDCVLLVEGERFTIPSKTFVRITLRCGVEEVTLFHGASDKTGTRVWLEVASTRHQPIYNIDGANTYHYATATYVATGG